jgi:hypothetical protein
MLGCIKGGGLSERDGRVRGVRKYGTSRHGHTHSEGCLVAIGPRRAQLIS